MQKVELVPSEQNLEEKMDQKHRAMVAIVTRTMRYLYFMEEMKMSNKIPDMFLDAVCPIKTFFIMLEPQLVDLRENDLTLKSQLDDFFSMITKEIDLTKTIEAYRYLKLIRY